MINSIFYSYRRNKCFKEDRIEVKRTEIKVGGERGCYLYREVRKKVFFEEMIFW